MQNRQPYPWDEGSQPAGDEPGRWPPPPTRDRFEDVALSEVDGEQQLARHNSPPLPLEYDGEIKPRLHRRHLIKGLLGNATKIVVFGLPGCGKSFLAYDWARHIGRGIDWFGRRTQQGRCVYLGAEGQAGLRLRHDAWNRKHPGGPDPFALIPTAVDLLDPRADMLKLAQTLECFAARFGGLDLLAIDTLAATFGGGDENGPDMSAYVANVGRLCAPYGCSSLIVTHAPLDATAKRPRGHGSLWGSADTVIQVSGDRDAPTRRIHVIKQKDDDPGADLLFKLEPVTIGTDEDGDEVTSCVVGKSELAASEVRGRRKLSAKEQIVFAALERAIVANGKFPPGEIPENVLNRVRVGKTVAMSEWRAEALSALADPDTKPDTARKAFDRARQQLQASAMIGVWEEWAWLF